jgi:hypothetical protein
VYSKNIGLPKYTGEPSFLFIIIEEGGGVKRGLSPLWVDGIHLVIFND